MTNNISTLAQSLTQIERLKVQQSSLQTLTEQLATGKKTQKFSGLGSDIITSQRARASINTIERYQNNITNANRRIEQMDNALAEIQAQADIILNSITIAPSQGDYPDFEVLQKSAEDVYTFILDLINSKEGDRFLFAGADTTTKPINDVGLLESSLGSVTFDPADATTPTARTGIIGDWGNTLTTDQFIAAYRGIDDTTLGYSAPLTNGDSGSIFARVDENKQIDYTVLGNGDGLREIITALGVLKELPAPEFAPGALNDPTAMTFGEDIAPFPPAERQESFYAVLNDLGTMLSQAVEKVEDERFRLSQTQVQMNTINDGYILEKKTFADTIGEIEDVDITEVSAKINSLQVQLQASYSVTALVSQLTFVNFFN